jgi:hypothetical protein
MVASRDTIAELAAIIIDFIPESRHELFFERLTHTRGNKSFRETVERLQVKYKEEWEKIHGKSGKRGGVRYKDPWGV